MYDMEKIQKILVRIINQNNRILNRKWNDEFELSDGSYSISDIQDYFEYILKKHGEKTINPLIKIYVNQTKNKITFKI